VDITSLAKLITNQKVEMQKPPPSLSNTQITAMLQRAKEISANFKNLSPTQSQRNNRAQHTKQLSYETIKPPTAKINMQPFVSYQSLPNPEKQTLSIETISKSQFNFLYVIGIGGFGKVWKVEHKRTGQVFAMKEMSKALVITKKSVGSVMNER
jgi:serum/glucocorticoid-regulated kinase 2